MSNLDRLALQNSNVLRRLPGMGTVAARVLLARNQQNLSDLRFETRYACSYALASERGSPDFQDTVRWLNSYVGATPVPEKKQWEYPWALANLRLESGMRILDAGCGTGPLQFAFASLGLDTHAVDPEENAEWEGIDRRLAKRFGCNITYRVEGIEQLSYASNSFDRVCCASVIEHCRAEPVADPFLSPLTERDLELQRGMIAEMLRVLKPGGLLVLTTDFYVPRDNCLFEANVNIANLLSATGAEAVPGRCPEPFPGEPGFTIDALLANGEIALDNYLDILQTSIGLTIRKRG